MKKKILLFTDWYEPGYKAGGPIQSCKNFVAAMQSDYEIYVATSAYDLSDTKPYPGVVTDAWISLKVNAHIFYCDKKKISLKLLKNFLHFVKPDFIYLNSMYSFRYSILPVMLKVNNSFTGKMVIAPRGMLQEGALQFKSSKKRFFLKLLNFLSVEKKVIFHATDDQEKKDILKYFPKANKIFVVQNFHRTEVGEWKQTEKQIRNIKCIFISRIAPKKNLLFLLKALAKISSSIKVELALRGEIENNEYWKQCTDVIDSLPENIQVNFNGPIPNDKVFEELYHHHLFVLPTFGENFGHAIFEALISGKPVLLSDRTPWRNLSEKKIGWDISLDRPELFIKAIEQMAEFNQNDYNEWSRNAMDFAKDYSEKLNLKESYSKIFA